MSDGDDYVTQREFDRTVIALERSIEVGQRRTDEEMRRLNDNIQQAIAKLTPVVQPPSQAVGALEAAILALHHAAEAIGKKTAPGNTTMSVGFGSLIPVVVFLAWNYLK